MIKCMVIMPYVSLVVPCYNEGEHLEKSLPKVIAQLKKLKKSFELVIIDDLSQDQTVKIINAFIKKNNSLPIRFIQHKKNIGRGGTVAEGIRLAKGEIAGFIDIDLEISPSYIPQFLEMISGNKADVVVGRRRYPFTQNNIQRIIASKLYSSLIQHTLKLPIRDTEAGYKFFNREKIIPILPKAKNAGWFWDTEIIALSYRHNLKVVEKNVLFKKRNDKTSTVNLFRDTLEYIKCLWSFLTHKNT